jgi:hypothetical protein
MCFFNGSWFEGPIKCIQHRAIILEHILFGVHHIDLLLDVKCLQCLVLCENILLMLLGLHFIVGVLTCVLRVATNVKCKFNLAKIAHLNQVLGQMEHSFILVLTSTVVHHNLRDLSRTPFE